MKKWSDTGSGVTVSLEVEQERVKMRSSRLPALWVGGEADRDRSKDGKKLRKEGECSIEVGALKSPMRRRGVPSSG